MKKYILSMLFVLLFAVTAHADGVLTLSAGIYSPAADIDSFDPGTAIGITYSKGILPFIDLQLNGMQATASGDSADLTTKGGEILAVFSLPLIMMEPYAGIGYGYYQTEIDSDTTGKETYYGNGPVLQAGMRFNFVVATVGAYVKMFQNNTDVNDENIDAGGTLFAVEGGLKF